MNKHMNLARTRPTCGICSYHIKNRLGVDICIEPTASSGIVYSNKRACEVFNLTFDEVVDMRKVNRQRLQKEKNILNRIKRVNKKEAL